jgi:hypothetical protein
LELRFFVIINAEMVEEKKSVDPALPGFYEAMERTNVEKFVDEMLAGLYGGSSDSEDFDVESDNNDTERGGQVMLYLKNPLLREDILKQ